MKVIIVEDEVLLALALENIITDSDHEVVGIASTYDEAMHIIGKEKADLAFVDIQLADGPTGIRVAQGLVEAGVSNIVFTTGNISRIPSNYAGAVGAVRKPYSERGLEQVLAYLEQGITDPPPSFDLPPCLLLSPAYEREWAAA